MKGGESLVAGLTISVTRLPAGDGVCSVLCLAGEADTTATDLRDALAAELAGGARLLLVDTSRLTFIDSGATQMIIAAHRVARQEGSTLALVRPSAPVARVLELVGVNQLVSIYDDVEDAVTAVVQEKP